MNLAKTATRARRALLPLLVLVTSTVFWLSPHLVADMHFRGDGEFHHDAAVQFSEGLDAGVAYPSWAARAQGGLGSPVFIYYPPLFHYAFHIVDGLVGNSWYAMYALEAFAMFLTALIVYLAASWAGAGVGLALAAGVTASAGPFGYMTLIYVHGTPWHVAYPFIAASCFALVLIQQGRLRFAVVLTLGVFLLTATHALASLMVLLCLPFGVLPFLLFSRERAVALKRGILAGASALLGMLLAGVSLWPALRLSKLMNIKTYSQDVNWEEGFALPLLTGTRWAVFQWGMGLLLLGMLGYAVVTLARHRGRIDERWRVLASFTAIGLAALFFSSEASLPLWRAVEPLRRIQYAYRFFSVLSVVAALGVVLAMRLEVGHTRARLQRAAGWGLLALSLLFSLAVQAKYFMVDGQPRSKVVNEDAVADANAFLPATARALGGEYAKNGGLEAECRRAGATIATLEALPEKRRWQISSPEAWRARLPLFAYPCWRASIDGVALETSTDGPTGLLAVDVPAGTATVEVVWEQPPERRQGLLLSGLGLLGLVAQIYLLRRARAVPG